MGPPLSEQWELAWHRSTAMALPQTPASPFPFDKLLSAVALPEGLWTGAQLPVACKHTCARAHSITWMALCHQ